MEQVQQNMNQGRDGRLASTAVSVSIGSVIAVVNSLAASAVSGASFVIKDALNLEISSIGNQIYAMTLRADTAAVDSLFFVAYALTVGLISYLMGRRAKAIASARSVIVVASLPFVWSALTYARIINHYGSPLDAISIPLGLVLLVFTIAAFFQRGQDSISREQNNCST